MVLGLGLRFTVRGLGFRQFRIDFLCGPIMDNQRQKRNRNGNLDHVI